MTKYLIKLKPLDTFFFSQENKYRKKLKNGKTMTEADYFQRSAYFPQQTTVFGMLRYYILLMNDQIPITDDNKAKKLIGSNSFDIGNSDPSFGKINSISEIFIIDKDNKKYYKNPKDIVIKDDKIEYLNREKAVFKTNLSNDMQFMKNYIEKEGLSEFLYHSDDDFMAMDYDNDYDKKKNPKFPNGIFIEKEQVGITKNTKGGTLENAFYKQVFYSLLDGYSFAFFAELEDDLQVEDGFVSMGAEKNPFKITFEKLDKIEVIDISINKNNPKIVLLSDAYLSNYDKNDFQFAISSTKTFRFLKTEVKQGNKYYSSNPLKKKEIKRSDKYNLLEKGSVFYFKDNNQMDTFSNKLNSETNFIQIGYNQHLKIQ